jgi:hypothetical protein
MDLLTVAKKIADRLEAESLKQNAPAPPLSVIAY